jgi:cytochrome c biogenesis protein CcmG/thiol:disulfide interchange protein DsbE
MTQKTSPFLYLPIALLLAFLVVGGFKLVSKYVYAPPKQTALMELELPQFLPGSEMKKFSLKKRRGEKVLVNFFASWCVPCVAEIPVLKGIQRKRMIPMIGVAYNDREELVGQFVEKYTNPYTFVLMDHGGAAAIDWGVRGVPESFLIGEKGELLVHHTGPLTPEIWMAEFDPYFQETVQ